LIPLAVVGEGTASTVLELVGAEEAAVALALLRPVPAEEAVKRLGTMLALAELFTPTATTSRLAAILDVAIQLEYRVLLANCTMLSVGAREVCH